MTWYTHLKITQPKYKKKNPPKLKLTHSTQIKLTLKLDSNVISLLSLLPLLPLFPLSLASLSKNLFHEWSLSFEPQAMGQSLHIIYGFILPWRLLQNNQNSSIERFIIS